MFRPSVAALYNEIRFPSSEREKRSALSEDFILGLTEEIEMDALTSRDVDLDRFMAVVLAVAPGVDADQDKMNWALAVWV